MWIVRNALDRPCTIIVMVLLILLATPFALLGAEERLLACAYGSVRLQLALPQALEVPANTSCTRSRSGRILARACKSRPASTGAMPWC